MSLVKLATIQVGKSGTASNNFHWRNLLDGLLRLTRGNAGAPITDVMRVKEDNSVEFPGGIANKNQCTAWVNFNGTGTVAIRDSFNVSSITDNGTGDYTVNFATAMNNSNYAESISAGTAAGSVLFSFPAVTKTTTQLRLRVATVSPVLSDADLVSASFFGGK